MLEAWAAKSGDPDLEAANWPRLGTLAGITEHPGQPSVYPDAREPIDAIDLEDQTFEAPDERCSYAAVEASDYAWQEMGRLADLGYLDKCESLDVCMQKLGGEVPVVSRFGLVTRTRFGKTKHRVILDNRESGVTAVARKNQRILLPRATDLVFDVLRMQADWAEHSDVALAQEDGLVEAMVLDVSDAFWALPLNRRERRFFVGRLRETFFLYRRLAQGSRGDPLAWCRFFGLVLRLTQGCFRTWEAVFEGYVDDPVATLGGPKRARSMCIATIVALWRALNIPLSFRKGQRGVDVVWIGFRFRVLAEGVDVQLMEDTYRELLELLHSFMGRNLLGVQESSSTVARTASQPWRGRIKGFSCRAPRTWSSTCCGCKRTGPSTRTSRSRRRMGSSRRWCWTSATPSGPSR